jgi:NAD(P)-dependent dehydrogenase (short-subunit alcohol dehydrogenase family)
MVKQASNVRKHLRRFLGAIVNFSSSAVGLALPSYAASAASKSASDAITPVLARELRARDITVNAIASALERPGAAADIANLVAFPISEDGRWVNGQVIRANGVIGSQAQGHGPGISTGARDGEKRHADQVNINSWRSS